MLHRLKGPVLAAMLACLATPAWAASPNHPDRAWRVLETPHFAIHYYQGEEKTARRVAQAAEDTLPRLAKDFGIEVTEPIPVILSRDNFFNGSAEPVKTRIQLDPVLAASSVIGTERFVAHELTHIITFLALQGDMPLSRLNNLGGLPTWFLEGIAQYEGEYWYASNDRMLRLSTLGQQLLTRTERENFPMLGMQAGAAGYNEGFSLTRYMFDTYGHGKIADLFALLRGSESPGFTKALEKVTGKSFDALQADWQVALRAHYADQTRGLSDQASGSVALVDSHGEANAQGRFSPDGKQFAYLTSRNQDGYLYMRGHVMGFLSLVVADANGAHPRELPLAKGRISKFAWSPDGKQIVVSMVTSNEQAEPTFDLLAYDLKTGQSRQLTHDANATDPAWSPDGQKIAFVSTQDGDSAIKIVDPRDAHIVELPRESLGDRHAADLAWSPDGKQLAASVYATGEGAKLAVIDPLDGRIQMLTEGGPERNDSGPCWSADGASLYFSSDRDGMQNLYKLSLRAPYDLRQLSRVYNGAAAPTLCPDGQLAYVAYRAVGSEIRTYAPGPGEALDYTRPRDRQPGTQLASRNPGPVSTQLPSSWSLHDYDSVMTSDALMPQVVSDERGSGLGVLGIYSDVLEKQQLGMDVRWGLLSQRFSYGASYLNRMGAASWGVSLYDIPSIAMARTIDPANLNNSLYWERQQGVSLIGDTALRGSQHLTASLGLSYLSVLTDPLGGAALGLRNGRLQTLNLGWNDSQLKNTSDADLNPSEGYRAAAGFSFSDRSIGSQFSYSQYSLGFERYVPIVPAWRHNLTVRGGFGLVAGEGMPQFLGGVMGGGAITPLRGYNVGSFVGSRIAEAGLDYTLPINGHMDLQFGPLYLDKLYASAFVEGGDAWDPGQAFEFHSTAGAELRVKTSFMGRQVVTFRVGVARKLTADGPLGMYLAF